MKNNQFPSFRFQRLQEASKEVIQRLKEQLASSEQDRVSKLAEDLTAVSPGKDDPIALAFVGQYNAENPRSLEGSPRTPRSRLMEMSAQTK